MKMFFKKSVGKRELKVYQDDRWQQHIEEQLTCELKNRKFYISFTLQL